jgi:hypothetical protein
MKKSMKAISVLNQQLVHEKEKEVKALSQVVEAKSKVVAVHAQENELHKSLIETRDKAF